MILYRLKCAASHEFDAWFKDSQAYDEQVSTQEVSCPYCASVEVGKAIMAPRLNTKSIQEPSEASVQALVEEVARQNNTEPSIMAQHLLRAIHGQVQRLCEDVGDNFVEEARKIHYNESAPRNIYGRITLEEAKELQDEGVDFYYIPTIPSHNA